MHAEIYASVAISQKPPPPQVLAQHREHVMGSLSTPKTSGIH